MGDDEVVAGRAEVDLDPGDTVAVTLAKPRERVLRVLATPGRPMDLELHDAAVARTDERPRLRLVERALPSQARRAPLAGSKRCSCSGAKRRPTRSPIFATKPGGEEVPRRPADELRDELVDRPRVKLGRRRVRLEHAVTHERDAVRHGERLELIMRHEDRGDPDLLLEALDLAAHLVPQPGVEIRERLVQQKDVRPLHERARERDALLLATGELRGSAIEQCVDLDERGGLAHAPLALFLAHGTAKLEREADVLGDRHVRVQRVALEDHADPAFLWEEVIDTPVAEEDLSARRTVDASDHEQGRGLPAAGRPEERDELARADLEVE